MGLLAAAVLTAGLFAERYGVNLLRYHTPVPDCGQVLSVADCSHYGPWIRDHNFAAAKPVHPEGPLAFTQELLYGMWLRIFFAVDGPLTDFQTRGPLTMPARSAIAIVVIGAAALAVCGRQVWRRYDAGPL